MSWSPDLYIGELRPWPDSVHVVRGNTDETRRYFPERKDGQEALERRIDELCAEAERHKAEYARLCDGYGSMSREHTQAIVELSDAYEKIDRLEAENAKLCQQLADVTESMGRMEERCAKLREQVRELWSMAYLYAYDAAPVSLQALMRVEKELQALGIEVGK